MPSVRKTATKSGPLWYALDERVENMTSAQRDAWKKEEHERRHGEMLQAAVEVRHNQARLRESISAHQIELEKERPDTGRIDALRLDMEARTDSISARLALMKSVLLFDAYAQAAGTSDAASRGKLMDSAAKTTIKPLVIPAEVPTKRGLRTRRGNIA